MTTLPMFPLGSVLFPHMPLPLHVFEPRYRALVEDRLAAVDRGDPPEFGVVLIERGREVGGGDQRFTVGTVARIVQVGALDGGRYEVMAVGTGRLHVTAWGADDPFPRAEVDVVDEPTLDPGAADDLLPMAELAVRRCLALKAELDEPAWPSSLAVAEDPTTAAWQLAAIAPLGPLDQLALLRCPTPADLLVALTRAAEDEAAVLAFRLGSG